MRKYYNRFMSGMMYALFALCLASAFVALIVGQNLFFVAFVIAAGISYMFAGEAK
ncbi:hypothetical protein NGI46_08055 [Peribacillus butanolivorans]|uniref:hypothetical protein n=1 Tax=Peribacillus butanolivorans TaxID=421767 RepID=UPI00207CB85A|nr:hypothetical protein [Peribacillus butanolivorans]MCO0597420.1 hypothetical protein [Peribacillus butanolivorans]